MHLSQADRPDVGADDYGGVHPGHEGHQPQLPQADSEGLSEGADGAHGWVGMPLGPHVPVLHEKQAAVGMIYVDGRKPQRPHLYQA